MTRPLHPLISNVPDPDHPGWWTWDIAERPEGAERYNATLGRLIVRGEGDGKARCRMFPNIAHSNLGNVVHGGAILTFIDMAMFAGGHAAGADIAFSVTLDLSAQFLAPAELDSPLDATVELLRETKRLAFLRGLVVQDKETVAAWSGTLRKNFPRP
jgi:uncharacterized protein (TIGR00369 family)